jgi:hypothetical protein
MRSIQRWVSTHLRATAAGVVSVVGAALFVAWPTNPITQANFVRIQIGTSEAELRHLLGPPDFQLIESGLIDGPETYVTNRDQSDDERRRRGFRDYRREQWTSAEVEIVVISDMEGRVVCKYSGPGQRTGWFTRLRLWLSRWL